MSNCTCNKEATKPLFCEILTESEGLAADLPDLLWGASVGDLKGIEPAGVYLYDWREVARSPQMLIRSPYIDMGPAGLYEGRRRDFKTRTGDDEVSTLYLLG